jgi:hypothetical protein
MEIGLDKYWGVFERFHLSCPSETNQHHYYLKCSHLTFKTTAVTQRPQKSTPGALRAASCALSFHASPAVPTSLQKASSLSPAPVEDVS